MMMKKCLDCLEEKELQMFPKSNRCRDGHKNQCNKCYQQKYHPHKEKPPFIQWWRNEGLCIVCGEIKTSSEFTKSPRFTNGLYKYCKNCVVEYLETYGLNNIVVPDFIDRRAPASEDFRKYMRGSLPLKERIKSWNSRVYTKKQIQKKNDCYKKDGRLRQYRKNYLNSNPSAKIASNLRSRMGQSLKYQLTAKSSQFSELIGCSWKFLVTYIESKFLPGMTWENYGRFGWHVDHIIPCNYFDLSDSDNQKKCFHYSNLQPLWWIDNLKKSNDITLF